ncbi:endolytic transglycosylase MltG [Aquirhabdus parva]|uniref:Endolytic murein transglycosylase n=1 Tax=Aquirhabdus parva TaxID=2283318 RepID=A0A345P6U6_9GAMM|nr:endolytic transglycosylase MltG [Aquirhabdus parva]AXI03005.1 endolytic transglycosylase MltG [Aquirhabdus parva]
MPQPPRKAPNTNNSKKTTAKSSSKRSTHSRGAKTAGKHNQSLNKGFPWFKSIGLILSIFFCIAVWQSLFRPISISENGKILQIKNGQTYSGLINYMAQRDMVRFPLIVKTYQHIFIHNTLMAGAYELPAGVNAYQLLNLLNRGELAQLNRVLLVEGMTFNQLRKRLQANDEVEKTVLDLPDAQLMAKLGINEKSPEGWFAPDTYFFTAGVSDVDVLKLLYEKQKKIVSTEWKNRAPDLPYHTQNDALTMASIVEKETGVDGERAKVAAVFVNRLKQGMRLQTDPTVIYGLGDRYEGNITRKDLETPTLYNTYTINGLPPTPIAMPGQAAIHAALHPAKIDALYFVATGTGGHKFSNTLAEHNLAVQQYLQVMRARKDTNSVGN